MVKLESREGKEVPQCTFMIQENGEWKKVSTDDVFANKKVVVFSLPGAFTPTCSSQHLPRYNELTPIFKQHGIDTVVCISVNDTFVMNEWAKDQECSNVMLLPDGNGDFTEGMGMLVAKNEIGFGKRSWRYSMLVENKKITKMFIEPDVAGDPFEVSDADTMLKHIAPKAVLPHRVAIFTRDGCPYCAKAKDMLKSKNIDFAEVKLNHHIRGKVLAAMTGKMTVPQVFIDGKHIGGSEDLEAYLKKL